MFSKAPISKAGTYQEIGAFWDEQDATEFGEQTEVEFDVNIKSQVLPIRRLPFIEDEADSRRTRN